MSRIARVQQDHRTDGDIYSGFASPLAPLNEELGEFIIVEYARNYIRHVLSSAAKQIDSCSSGITTLYEAWLQVDADFQMCWDVSFGELHRLPHSAPNEFMARVIGLALRLASCGVPTDWSCIWDEPMSFRIGGQLFGHVFGVRAEWSCGRCLLSWRLEHGLWDELAREATPHPELRRPIQKLRLEHNELFVLSNSATSGISSRLVGTPASDEHIRQFIGAAEGAVSVLRQYAPQYLKWIDKILRSIILLEPIIGGRQSGTEEAQFGLIHMSYNSDPVLVAETLIHEAAHQYMTLLTRIGPVDDGSDVGQYYSPFKGMNRPIGSILAAYHAFANLALFYHALASNGISTKQNCVDQSRDLAVQLEQLEVALAGTRAMTTVGEQLWLPLRRQLLEAGLA